MRAAGRYPGYGFRTCHGPRLHRIPRISAPTLRAALSGTILALFDFAIIFGLALLVVGCATVPTTPPLPPEVRTQTVQVQVPVPVPCFTDADRPTPPKSTPIDPETATTEQLAAAELADALAWRAFADAVDALFLQCSTKGTP